ncbi:MAG TPA: hypothetical protein PKC49_02720 [Phycisphaerae bacterium]|nr:hypothetical protein [Phycisphaerae bacterium]
MCGGRQEPGVGRLARRARIAVVDVLRGVALLGIPSVNMAFFSTPASQ